MWMVAKSASLIGPSNFSLICISCVFYRAVVQLNSWHLEHWKVLSKYLWSESLQLHEVGTVPPHHPHFAQEETKLTKVKRTAILLS